MAHKLRSVVRATSTLDRNGWRTDRDDVSVHAASDDAALTEALFVHARAFAGAGSLATTALLLASQFTTKGAAKSLRAAKARDAVLDAIDADSAEIERRRAAYWTTRGPR